MQLKHSPSRRSVISLVPLVDVMLILLVFFMVTSTYLDLDMVPVVEKADAPSLPPAPTAGEQGRSSALLIRLGSDGLTYVRGRALDATALGEAIETRLQERADAPIVVLPSGRASAQSLVSVMETASRAGASALRVVRLEASP
jgi:biopolymer transport protein ExbD